MVNALLISNLVFYTLFIYGRIHIQMPFFTDNATMAFFGKKTIVTSLILASALACGCAGRKASEPTIQAPEGYTFTKSEGPAFPAGTPESVTRYTAFARIKKTEDGQTYIYSYSMPPAVIKKGHKPERWELKLDKPIRVLELPNAIVVLPQYPTMEAALAAHNGSGQPDLATRVAQQTLPQVASIELKNGEAKDVPVVIDEETVQQFADRLARIQKNTVFDPNMFKPRTKANPQGKAAHYEF